MQCQDNIECVERNTQLKQKVRDLLTTYIDSQKLTTLQPTSAIMNTFQKSKQITKQSDLLVFTKLDTESSLDNCF